MADISIRIEGSEGVIKRLSEDSNILKPLEDMVKDITSLMGRATREAAVVRTGRLKSSVLELVVAPLAGQVGLASFVPYARYNAFGAPARNFLARHAENGVPVVDGYGYTNYGFNTSLKEAWRMAFAARDEIIRRLTDER